MRPLAIMLALPAAAIAAPTPSGLEAALEGATVGAIVDLGFSSTASIPALNAAPNRLATTGGTLLYSDDPETALQDGILYRDTMPAGLHRIYLYHVNGTASPRRFSIVLENQGAEAANVTPTKRSMPAASGNYLQVGREGSRLHYENATLPPALVVPAGGRALLDAQLDGMSASTNQLVATMHDYTTDRPLRVSVVMVPAGADTLATYPSMIFSPNDGNAREGTFAGTTRSEPSAAYAVSTSGGMRKLRIGDPNAGQTDPPLAGTDAETGLAALLKGNYGVTYDIDLSVANDTSERLGILLNPRGGNYGGYVRTTLNGATTATMVPTGSLVVPPTTQGGVCALLDLPHGTSTLKLEFIPAGASSLPIEFLLVPYGTSSPMPGASSWSIE